MTTGMLNLDQELQSALNRHLDGVPGKLSESMRYSLMAPGKRIRPRLCLSCAAMLGLSEKAALPPALALEMTHCFTLIHDDLPSMDNDDFRRGKPTNHKVFGEAVALLAGDALVYVATRVFLESASLCKPENWLRAFTGFTDAIGPKGVIGGQVAEFDLNGKSTLEALYRVQEMKTGALFLTALMIPVHLAGLKSEDPKSKTIEDYARKLGRAFQIVDDLEDAQQDENRPSTTVLKHMSVEQARTLVHQSLKEAQENLKKQFGPASEPLVRIAEEVIRRA